MSTEPTDRRVRRTKARLHEALRELILKKRDDKITVQDIIDRTDVGGRRFLLETGRQHITAVIEVHLDNRVPKGYRLPVPLEVATQYFAGAMMCILVWWVDSDTALPPEEVNAMYQAMTAPAVQHLFEGG